MNGITNQIRIGEDIPLEPGQTSKVFVNTVYLNRKTIDQTPGKNSAMDVEINTKIPVGLHSKKLKGGLLVVITVSTLSAILSISLAYYHCVNMSLLQKQVDFLLLKMENISSQQRSDSPSLGSSSAEAQIAGPHSIYRDVPNINIYQHTMPPTPRPTETHSSSVLPNDMFVAHFNGAYKNPVNLGTDSSIGPWVRDDTVSSPNSYDKFELEKNYVVVKESGLYMLYIQIMYISQQPCCYYVFASQRGSEPRQLASCATAGDGSARAASRALVSCATATVARLAAGDVVNIAQREHNRTLSLRKGYSYFGFIKLAS